ncbi:hypothetical protein PoMZ_11500 [Pyricularia oryzae]|uniref:Uncharacterized protein n=1 Tax=Pyricularia oryzae TaxID=318829 RepID=A0A4P7NKH8_PYROR|nr:hypothetical protein PoMZ_11500 [Pyricularia oryzae]
MRTADFGIGKKTPSRSEVAYLEPLARAQSQIKPILGPPAPDGRLVAKGILQRLLDIHGTVFDLFGRLAVHARQFSPGVFPPPLQYVNIRVYRGVDEDLRGEDEIVVTAQQPPRLEDVYPADTRGLHADLVLMLDRDPAGHPPAQDVRVARLCRVEQRLARLELYGPGVGVPVVHRPARRHGRLAPPVQHADVALCACLLHRRLAVLERQARPPPPLEHVDVPVERGVVHGLLVVLFLQERGGPGPPVEDVGAAVVGRRLGRDGLAVKVAEHDWAVALDVGEHAGEGELEDEFDGERRQIREVCGRRLQHAAYRRRIRGQQAPLEPVHKDLQWIRGVFRLGPPRLRHLECCKDAERLRQFPVSGVLKDKAPYLWRQHRLFPTPAWAGKGWRCCHQLASGHVDVVPHGQEVCLVLDYTQDLVEASPLHDTLKVRRRIQVLVSPQYGRQHTHPMPLAVQFAYLALGDRVLPHCGGHSRNKQYTLRGVPAAQNLEDHGVAVPAHHLGQVIGVYGTKDHEVCPLDQLGGPVLVPCYVSYAII